MLQLLQRIGFMDRYAFGLEESGDRSKADMVARQALAINPDLPWAIHALGHVYEETQPPIAGIEHLMKWKPHWINSILSVHLTWHLCLFHLGSLVWCTLNFKLICNRDLTDSGDLAAVLEEYDGYMKLKLDDIFALVDGASLLWRLEVSNMAKGTVVVVFPMCLNTM